jgi:hypothetical protein
MLRKYGDKKEEKESHKLILNIKLYGRDSPPIVYT